MPLKSLVPQSSVINASKSRIANNLYLSYFIAFVVGGVFFLLLMVFVNWDLSAYTSPSLLFLPILGSGIAMKILGGVGLAINFAVICQLVFRGFSSSMKGRKGRVRIIKVILLVLAVIICGYAVYNILGLFLPSQPQSLIDFLLNLYGALSLLLWVYILPAIRGGYGEEDKGVLDRIREKIGGARYSLWKGYKYRVRRDYGAVYAAEYERLQLSLEGLRDQLSGLLLFPLALVLLIFPPLLGLVLVLWLRLFSLEETPLTRGERLLLILISTGILLVSVFVTFSLDVPVMLSYFSLAYGLGILAGVFILAYLVIKS
jgi:hypothetical protein